MAVIARNIAWPSSPARSESGGNATRSKSATGGSMLQIRYCRRSRQPYPAVKISVKSRPSQTRSETKRRAALRQSRSAVPS